MDVTNNTSLGSDSHLKPKVDGAWGFFKRMRILCGGQIVEDIDSYNRLHEMYHMMKKKLNLNDKNISKQSKKLHQLYDTFTNNYNHNIKNVFSNLYSVIDMNHCLMLVVRALIV